MRSSVLLKLVTAFWSLIFQVVVLDYLRFSADKLGTRSLRRCSYYKIRLSSLLWSIKARVTLVRSFLLLLNRWLFLCMSWRCDKSYDFLLTNFGSTEIEVKNCLFSFLYDIWRHDWHNIVEETFNHFFVVLSSSCFALKVWIVSRFNFRWVLHSLPLTLHIRFLKLWLVTQVEAICKIDFIDVLVLHKVRFVCTWRLFGLASQSLLLLECYFSLVAFFVTKVFVKGKVLLWVELLLYTFFAGLNCKQKRLWAYLAIWVCWMIDLWFESRLLHLLTE